jgi:MOSC domain-containing protein YiiM
MLIESLNIGLPKKETFYGKAIHTGIGKRSVSGSLHLKKLGFDGDGVADLKNHGGQDKAVCVYSLDHYPYWEELLGTKLNPPAFGENLSVSHLKEDDVCLGDTFLLGTAVVQISQPRQPCKTLAALYGRNDLVKLVVNSGYTGFYLRVLKEGIVEAGTTLVLIEKEYHQISVAFANHIYHHDRKNRAGVESILAVSTLSDSWRRDLRKLIENCY